MPQSDTTWRVPVTASDIPPEGRRFELAANEGERAAIARRLGLPALSRLEAHFLVRRSGAEGLHLSGAVSGNVTQTCVVTLDPVENEVEEAIDIAFSPRPDPEPGPEVEATLETPDPPESMADGRIDLAAIAVEFLQLGLDPYPRKPDAEFEPETPEQPAESPFAALAALRQRSGKE
jgi:uncharacterized metal-binding protein YceD (DUF177 family)